MRKFFELVLVLLVLGLASSGVRADPIGPDCPNNSCFGNIYALFYSGSPVSSTATTETFDITYAVNTAGYSNGPDPTGFLYAVGFKVTANGADFLAVTLLSAPDGPAAWTLHFGGVSNGCDNNTNGFVCADGDSLAVPDGLYEWVFEVTVNTGTLKGDSIKASFADASGKQHGNTSEDITLQTGGCPPSVCIPETPEPGVLSLIGIGLLGLGFVMLRRRGGTAAAA